MSLSASPDSTTTIEDAETGKPTAIPNFCLLSASTHGIHFSLHNNGIC